MKLRLKITFASTLFFIATTSFATTDGKPAPAESIAHCMSRGVALALHPDRATHMPGHYMVFRYYGKEDFNSATIIDLKATQNPNPAYRSGHMGFAEIDEDFRARGPVIESQYDWPAGLPDIAAVLQKVGEPGASLLDHNQTMSLGVMTKINYLDSAKRAGELKSMAERSPNQVTFLIGTEKTTDMQLEAENDGKIPDTAYPDPKEVAWRERFSAYDSIDGEGEGDGAVKPRSPDTYFNQVGSSMLISGQDLNQQYTLQIQTPHLKTPLPADEFKFLVGRGAQTKPGSFREGFRGAAYFSYYELILLDSIKNSSTHQILLSPEVLKKAKMYAQVNSEERRDHFTDPEKFSFQVYSKYSDDPQKFALSAPLDKFVDGEGIENFSHELGKVVNASEKTLTGREALELTLDARQRATYYLTETNQADPHEMTIRDFSSGLKSQIDLVVQQTKKIIPSIAPSAKKIAWSLSNNNEPIMEYQDVTRKAVEAGHSPYGNHIFGSEETLPDFLEENNAVEIFPATDVSSDPSSAKKMIVGAYLDYITKLKKLGIRNPEQFMIASKIQFAFTNYGHNMGSTDGMEASEVWLVDRPDRHSIPSFFYSSYIIEHGVHVRSDVFTVQTIQKLMRDEPEIAKSVARDHPFGRGQTHYDKFMSEPELLKP